MTGDRVYLDYNATAPVLPCAREAALRALDCGGNPSSVHGEGRAARALVEDARAMVGALCGVASDRVVFTSGGTEAAALALQPAMTGPDNLLLAGAGEHACVLQGHGYAAADTQILPLTQGGVLDLDALNVALAGVAGRRPTLALQAANNETGVVQPVKLAADLIHAHGGTLVCDAVQIPGRMDIASACDGADVIVISAHKLGGLKGAGAVIFRSSLPEPAGAMLRGGGQERGYRAGTENVMAIAAFGAAAAWGRSQTAQEQVRLEGLRAQLDAGLKQLQPDLVIFGEASRRLCNTTSFAVAGTNAETLLIALDLAGLSLSSGSACSSGKVKPSHVLEAMGIAPQLARGAIRVSLGHASTQGDVDAFLAGLDTILKRMKMRRMASAA